MWYANEGTNHSLLSNVELTNKVAPIEFSPVAYCSLTPFLNFCLTRVTQMFFKTVLHVSLKNCLVINVAAQQDRFDTVRLCRWKCCFQIKTIGLL